MHGITLEFLADKPKFQDVAQSFVEYLDGAELIIHNAAFDLDFLNEELARLQLESWDKSKRQRGWMTRCHATVLPSGRILLPLYSDGFLAGLMAISDDHRFASGLTDLLYSAVCAGIVEVGGGAGCRQDVQLE